MSEELKIKRSYAIPENEMVIIKDTNTLLHNIVDSELKEKDKEIERLNKNIQATRNCILKDIAILKTRNDISQEEMVTRLKATLIILGSDKE